MAVSDAPGGPDRFTAHQFCLHASMLVFKRSVTLSTLFKAAVVKYVRASDKQIGKTGLPGGITRTVENDLGDFTVEVKKCR